MKKSLLKVSVKGSGEPLILLHGLFGSADNLRRVALTLEDDYQVWRVDLRNHGESFHSDQMDYIRMVDDLYTLMQANNIQQAHLLGHSMGGKAAMQFALNFPEKVHSLLVADIAPVQYQAHHHAILQGLTSVNLHAVQNRKMADQQLASYIKESSVRQFLLKSLDLSDKSQAKWKFNLAAIIENYTNILDGCYSEQPFTGRTLFIAGGNSDYIKPEYRAQTMMLFPNAQLKIIPDASHWLHAEKPEIFIGICQRFLNDKA